MTTAVATQAGFLATLTGAEGAELLRHAEPRRWPPGATLLREGGPPEVVLVVRSGTVKRASAGSRETVYGFLGPGELLGELAALDGRPQEATVTAVSPVDTLVLPAAEFTRFVLAHPPVTELVLRMLASRLRDADGRRAEFGSSDTLARVTHRLVELADRFGRQRAGGQTRIALPLTQEELAGWVGSSREAVAKALRVLRHRRYIDTSRRTIVVLDLAALRRRA